MRNPNKTGFSQTDGKWKDLSGNIDKVFSKFENTSGNLDKTKLSNTLNSLFKSDFPKIKEYQPIFNEPNSDEIDFIHFERCCKKLIKILKWKVDTTKLIDALKELIWKVRFIEASQSGTSRPITLDQCKEILNGFHEKLTDRVDEVIESQKIGPANTVSYESYVKMHAKMYAELDRLTTYCRSLPLSCSRSCIRRVSKIVRSIKQYKLRLVWQRKRRNGN